MKNFARKITEKINMVFIIMMCTVQGVYADGIQNTSLATGTRSLIEDVTSWLTGIGIVVTILMVVYCLIRRNMADEMDHKKWQQRMTVSLVSGVGIVAATSVINVLVSYYQ